MNKTPHIINFIGKVQALLDKTRRFCESRSYTFAPVNMADEYNDSIEGQLIIIDPSCVNSELIELLEVLFLYNCHYYWKLLTIGQTQLSYNELIKSRLVICDKFPDFEELDQIFNSIFNEAKSKKFEPTRPVAYVIALNHVKNAFNSSEIINVDDFCLGYDLSEDQLNTLILLVQEKNKHLSGKRVLLNRILNI